MILAPEKKFIFIHVPKAAGTSLNAAFSIHDAFFPVRHGNVAAREHHAATLGLPPATAALGEHATARQFIATLGRATYDTYYAIGFVRNPWDVAVSWFHFRLFNSHINGHAEAVAAGTFQAYVNTVLAGPEGAAKVGLQYPYLVDESGALAVSFLGRHETLTDDFARIVATLRIETLTLDHFNQSYHAPWSTLYDRRSFDIVAHLVTRDAELFGYPSDPAAYGI